MGRLCDPCGPQTRKFDTTSSHSCLSHGTCLSNKHYHFKLPRIIVENGLCIKLLDVTSTLAQFVISQRTFLAWMSSINKKCHQIVILSLVQMSQLRRLWFFSPSVNSVFKRACAAVYWGYMSAFWSAPSSTSILHVCEQRRLWRDCADAQARLSLRWSPMR